MDAILFALILGTMVFGIVAQYVEVDREITAEETEKKVKAKYMKELRDWQMTATHPQVEITTDNKTFTLERRETMNTITIPVDKYDQLVKKANAFDLITELTKSDTYFMSELLTNVVNAQRELCKEIPESKTVEVKEPF